MRRRIVLSTFGSLGDLHPQLALGLELRRRGHDVLVATSEYHREKIVAEGFAFHALRPNIDPTDKDLIRATMDERRGPETIIRDVMMPALRDSYADLLAAVQGADLLVTSELTYAAPLIVELTGIPWVSQTLAPLSFFSTHDPSALPPAPWVTSLAALSPALYRGVIQLARWQSRSWGAPVHALRRELGLPPGGHPLFEGKHSPSLVLAMFSPLLGAPQVDWPSQTVATGFAFYDRHAGAMHDNHAGLARFLAEGDPPIVFTLGSAAVFDPGGFFEESARAARMLKRRAILLVGPQPEGVPPASAELGIFDYAPFSELFPRAAAIVHQGGVGTTAQAMRSGRPMLIVPFAHDQPDNAARAVRLGIARTVPRRKYRAARIAAELRPLLDDPSYATRAAAVGAVVSREDGARVAADALEQRLA